MSSIKYNLAVKICCTTFLIQIKFLRYTSLICKVIQIVLIQINKIPKIYKFNL